MPKRKLKDIDVTHISLVRAGANKKTILYKSDSKEAPVWQKEIPIIKEEEGIVYGIVYSPGETDTQGDITTAKEIKKAAYNFLKHKRVDNVDKNHSFKKEDAFVCESWLIRKGDPLFPKEKEGSWAVGIKIESEELKKEIKEGKLKAISMAGSAKVKEVQKASTLDELIAAIKEVFQSVNLNITGYYRDLEKGETNMPKEQKEQLEKEDLAKIVKEAVEPLTKSIQTEFKEALEKKDQEFQELAKEVKELKEALNKSRQNQTPPSGNTKTKPESIFA